jgi:hypothetical protein
MRGSHGRMRSSRITHTHTLSRDCPGVPSREDKATGQERPCVHLALISCAPEDRETDESFAHSPLRHRGACGHDAQSRRPRPLPRLPGRRRPTIWYARRVRPRPTTRTGSCEVLTW